MSIAFHPPFKHAQFSPTKKVELFEGSPDESLLNRHIDSSITRMVKNTFGHSEIAIVGYYGYQVGIGFFVEILHPDKGVYTREIDISTTRLVKIADSLDIFYQVLQKIYAIWISDARDGHLQKEASTKKKMNDLFNYLRTNSPGSSLAFWQLYFFADLHISLEP